MLRPMHRQRRKETKKRFFKKITSIKKLRKNMQEAFHDMVSASKGSKSEAEARKKYERYRDKTAEKIADLQLAQKHSDAVIGRMKAYVQSVGGSVRILDRLQRETERDLEDLYQAAEEISS